MTHSQENIEIKETTEKDHYNLKLNGLDLGKW